MYDLYLIYVSCTWTLRISTSLCYSSSPHTCVVLFIFVSILACYSCLLFFVCTGCPVLTCFTFSCPTRGTGFFEMNVRTCVYMYVCMYVCMYKCTYVCMYVCIYVRTYVLYVLCTYVCMYICTYVCIICTMYVCMYVRMYICMYVCKYVKKGLLHAVSQYEVKTWFVF